MLSAQKEDRGIEAVPFSPNLMLSSFGKVVGSIEGLRHKLDSLTINEIDETQEKVKTLSLRVGELQKTLERLSAIKDYLIRVETTKSRLDGETPSIAALESLQKPLQLHMLGQLRNLILLPRAKSGTTGTHAAEVDDDKGPAQSELAAALTVPARADGASQLRTSPQLDCVTPSAPFQQLRNSVHEQSSEGDSRHSSADEPQQPSPVGDDLLTAKQALPELSALDETEQPSMKPESYEKDFTLKEVGPADPANLESREALDGPPAAASESQPASGFEFDQRLLNDLIKDYGEFVIPPPSSTPVEATRPPAHSKTSATQDRAEFPLIENVTVQKTVPPTRKDGDLDRKLKKLIKDYGEYDLYSDQTSNKYRAGVVAVVVILAAVFGGIYFFSPTQNEALTNPSPETRSMSTTEQKAKGSARIETGSKAASGIQRDNSEQSDDSASRESGHKPPANKNNKNNEKVGR